MTQSGQSVGTDEWLESDVKPRSESVFRSTVTSLLMAESGGRRTTLLPLDSIQGLTLQQSWFQHRSRLATLHLQIAGGPQTLPFIPYTQALALANEALNRAENPAVQ
jgi:uncharacterized membrane protein YdbT with pleckstrin-like domain